MEIKNYYVYLIPIRQYRDLKEICIPVRGTSEEDVREYVKNELIPEIKNHETAILHFPGTEYQIDRITMKW